MHDKAIALDELEKQLNEKLKVCGYQEKLQILTLVPDTWSGEYISKDFDASEYEYLVWKAQKLKLAYTSIVLAAISKLADISILATPRKKAGKSLKPKAKQAVLDFYKNDEYSDKRQVRRIM